MDTLYKQLHRLGSSTRTNGSYSDSSSVLCCAITDGDMSLTGNVLLCATFLCASGQYLRKARVSLAIQQNDGPQKENQDAADNWMCVPWAIGGRGHKYLLLCLLEFHH